MLDKKLIEFLSQEDNLNFLLDMERLIPRVKDYIFKKRFELFIKEFITPKLWDNYKIIKVNDDSLLVNDQFSDFFINHNNDKYFHIAINGGIGEQNYYGIIGNRNKFNDSNLNTLTNKLKSKEMEGSWKHWLDWKYFVNKRVDLSLVSNQDEVYVFLKQWSETFWDFAGYIKESLEQTNQTIADNLK
jgi:hypothetical protein